MKFLAFLIIWSLTSNLFASSLQKNDVGYLLSKSLWGSVDWSEFKNSRIVKSLPNNEAPEISKDGKTKWLKRKDVNINGIHGHDQVVVTDTENGPQYSYGATFEVDFGLDTQCPKFLKKLRAIYGNPAGELSLSRNQKVSISKDTNSTIEINHIAEETGWKIGNTYIVLACIGLSADDEKHSGYITLNFEDESIARKVHPLTWIECETKSKVKIAGRTEEGEEQRYVFGLNDTHKTLHRVSKSKIGNTNVYNDEHIEVDIMSDNSNISISINRILGTMSMIARPKTLKSSYVEYKGTCEKIDAVRKRF
ncbi:hypothetical protein [Sedimenticola selenatireducens]|uniref:hypothetical protein n=1 Tax=Sedimenticola selenatireducens TaxID=191960 RepID=UPI00048D9091|nr:hypothetical protein [Sedimenticola selenatireducens]